MLMVKKEGDEKITNEESIFAQMVQKSGENMSKKIFETARKKYYETVKNKKDM